MYKNQQPIGLEIISRDEKCNTRVSNEDLLDLRIRADSDINDSTRHRFCDVWGVSSSENEYSSGFSSRGGNDVWTPFQIRNPSTHIPSRNFHWSYNYDAFNAPLCRSYSPNSNSAYPDSGYGSQVGGDTPTTLSMSLTSQEESVAEISNDFDCQSLYINLMADVNQPSVHDLSGPNPIKCSECPWWKGKTQSQKRKHEAAHRKDNKCEEEGCGKGFGTLNDLERHRKTVHSKDPRCGPTERYKCFGKTCRQSDKLWPRLDNFRAHLRRKHGNEDEKSLLDLSRTWYDTWKKGEEEPTRPRQENTDSITPFRMLHSLESYFNISQENLPLLRPQVGGDEQFLDKTKILPSESLIEPSFLQRPEEDEKSPAHIPILAAQSNIKLPGIQTLIQSTISEGSSIRRESTPEQVVSEKCVLPSVQAFEQGVALIHALAVAALQKKNNKTPCNNVEAKAEISPNEDIDATTQLPELKNQTKEEDLPRISRFSTEQKEFCLRMMSEMRSQLNLHASEPENSNNSVGDRLVKNKFVTYAHEKGEPKQEGFSCSVCRKVFGRQSTLNKHLKRHERPYGCTFAGCYGSFGSKADWKRHESMQHYHAQCFRCSLPRADHDQCALLFFREEEFVKHIIECQHTKNVSKDEIQEEIEKSRIGAYDHQSRFYYWCGFCREIKLVEKKGVDALNERFDHISDHFQNEKNIKEWFPAKGHTMKGARKKRDKNLLQRKNSSKRSTKKRQLGVVIDLSCNDRDDGEGTNYEVCPSSEEDTDIEAKQLSTDYYDQRNKIRKVNVPCEKRSCEKELYMYCCNCDDGPQRAVFGACMDCHHIFCLTCRDENQLVNHDVDSYSIVSQRSTN